MGAYDCDCINNLEYDRRERKAQLSKEGTTSDLISRTETVERLRGVIDVTVPITDYDDGFVDGVEFGVSTVSTMPTIQSVATDTNVGDTISRQQAIRWVKTECNPYGKPTLDFESGKKVIEHLKQMPPAQPEPKTGKWVYNSPVTVKCDQCGFVINDWDCHRFNYCPNCGADTKGKKNE